MDFPPIGWFGAPKQDPKAFATPSATYYFDLFLYKVGWD